jgi:dihydroneopterin aldolase/D-erythro-7,8-dihydroneopterin triphosphate epimerase
MDRMHIRDLVVSCIIGTKPEERRRKQKVVLDIVLQCNLGKAGRTDRLDDAVNYKTLSGKIIALVSNSKFFLIERLAERIAAVCLGEIKVSAVTVSVEKPAALEEAKGVSVVISRRRGRK